MVDKLPQMANNEQIRNNQLSQRRCENCDSYVSKQFIRVFGANNGKAYGCQSCMTGRQIRDGKCKSP